MPIAQFILMSLPSLSLFLQLQVWRIKQALASPSHAMGPKRPDLAELESQVKTPK